MTFTDTELARSFDAGEDPPPVDDADVRLRADPVVLAQLTDAMGAENYDAAEQIIRDH